MSLNDPTDFLQSQATSALQGVENTRVQILNSATSPPSTPNSTFSVEITKPNTGSAPVFSDMFQLVDGTTPEVLRLNDEADAYMAKYFPSINGCLKTIPDDWLCDVISGVKPFGIESTIFDLVWQKARDRANRGQRSEQRSIEANMSSRGFSLPTGALMDLTLQLSQRVADSLAEVNRDQAIKDAEIKLDILKFAEEQALRYKLGLMQAMADLYKVWAIIPNNDIERARIKAQAMASFYQALGSYYNVEMSFEELRVRAEQLRTGVELSNVDGDIRAYAASKGDNGLGQAAQAFGEVAAASASAAASFVAQIESI